MKPLDPRLLRYARSTRRHLAVSVALGLVTAAAVVVQAELVARAVAGVAGGELERADLGGVLVAMALVVGVRATVAGVQDRAAQRSSARAKSELRGALVARAAALGPDAAAGRAELATLSTTGLDALDGYFGQYLPQLVLAVVVPPLIVARLAVADPIAAVTVVLTLPLVPVFMVLAGRLTESATAARWTALARLSHHFLDVVGGMTTLKLFGRAAAQPAAIRQSTDRYRRTTMATLRIAFLSSLVLELVATLSVALVAVGVGLRLVDGGLDLRTGLLVIVLAPEAYLPLRLVGARYHAAADGVAAAGRAIELLEVPQPACGVATDVPDLGRPDSALRIERVSVAHPGRVGFAPDRAELVARRGELLVITGATGCGKTTLLGVLLGGRRPDEGRVVVEGGGRRCGLEELDPEAWRARLAWVDQRPYLFAASVADNVRLARPEASDAEVRTALDRAGLADMAAERWLGERGQGVSSGEARRLAVARAVLRRSPVLLLDEPTAGLDTGTERAVLATVRALAADSIVIMVSHRPAAIAWADRVVALRSTVEPAELVGA